AGLVIRGPVPPAAVGGGYRVVMPAAGRHLGRADAQPPAPLDLLLGQVERDPGVALGDHGGLAAAQEQGEARGGDPQDERDHEDLDERESLLPRQSVSGLHIKFARLPCFTVSPGLRIGAVESRQYHNMAPRRQDRPWRRSFAATRLAGPPVDPRQRNFPTGRSSAHRTNLGKDDRSFKRFMPSGANRQKPIAWALAPPD